MDNEKKQCSNLLLLKLNIALIGPRKSIPTIMIGNIDMELPAMYMMKRFIGICFNGANAISQDFFTTKLLSTSRLPSF